MISPAGKFATPSRTVASLDEEYRAIRQATLALGPPNRLLRDLDFSAVALAYQNLKYHNQIAVQINRALQRQLIPALPTEIQLNNIGFCNLRCPHCPTHGTDANHAIYQSKRYTMERAAIASLAAETFPYAGKATTSGIGEGLLHKDFDAIVANAARYGVKIFTNTNGTTLLPKLVGALFGVTELRLSIDGATPATFEAIRRGAKYATVMKNVLAVMRANERLPQSLRLVPTVNYGICASNARDIPLMVDLCAYLGLPLLHGFNIQPLNPRYAADDISRFPAYYKHWHQLATQRARGRNIVVLLPPPDPTIEADANAGPGSDDGEMIVAGIDHAYYEELADFDRQFGAVDLEPEIEAMMIAALEAGIARHQVATQGAVREAMAEAEQRDADLLASMQRGFDTLRPEEVIHLRSMHRSDRGVNTCFFLQAHLIYNADGAVRPCCDPTIAPIGNAATSAREILRDVPLQTLIDEFRSGQFREDCLRCPLRQIVPERAILPIALG